MSGFRMTRIKACAAALAVVLSMPGATPSCLADPRLTATEIFHLRSECGRLSKQVYEENHISSKKIHSYVSSNYDENTNRCYVLVTHVFMEENSRSDSLYDGQGGGIIADCFKDGGFIRGVTVSHEQACSYIAKMMQDDLDKEKSE